MGKRGSTSSQLRDDIDRGRTGDKVDHEDPAAAPLGTDDEAAGRPPRGDQVEQTRRQERASAPAEPGEERGTRFMTGWLIAFLLLTGVLSFIALYWPVG